MEIIFVCTKSITFNTFLKSQANYLLKKGFKVKVVCSDIENLNFTESLPILNSIKILRLEGSTSKAAESEAVTMDFKSRESLINEFFEHWKFNALSEENRIKALEYYGTQNIDFLNKFPNLTELMINNLSIKELKPLKNLKLPKLQKKIRK